MISLLLSFSVQAKWVANFERAGFLGSYALGVGYETESRHAFEGSIGTYSNDGKNQYQTNLLYRYSGWEITGNNKTWRPLQVGVFTIRSWDRENYFTKSPDQYPYEGYYDFTAFRAGLEVSNTLIFNQSRIAISYRFRILDNGIVAVYNNSHKDLQYYISSGLALSYLF